ncbi:hypothetical protein V1291_005136 [Nitrobacteraceae bacterium AZCC 1564]
MSILRVYSSTNELLAAGPSAAANTAAVNLTCPHCGRMGSFSPVNNVNDAGYARTYSSVNTTDNRTINSNQAASYSLGVRTCPNTQCNGLVAVIMGDEGRGKILRRSFPPELINFRTDNIPPNLVASMKEAIASHSVEAYRASALMVRRTLELLCELKQATGNNLKERLANLSQHAILPHALLEAADHLRLMGNDAAHIEAKSYDDIDREHSEIAIEVAREILKAVYQHDDLVARLNKLKRPAPPPNPLPT